jgi:putative thioredoxin
VAAPSPWIRDVADADFEREVLARSATTPVVVDFWAPWCGPCRTLGPLLERLAEEAAGEFVLVKVNVDESPRVAGAFGVRSIPTVLGFRDGAIVAEFAGAQPERAVREFLARVRPRPADRLAAEAARLAAAGDASGAETHLRKALEQDARHARALLALARVLAERGDAAEALALLGRVSAEGALAQEAERLAARLRTTGDGVPDEAALRARVAANPSDLRARIDLGKALAAREDYDAALGELLAAVKLGPDLDDGAARKALLDVFALLGPRHPTTARWRGELAKALYR